MRGLLLSGSLYGEGSQMTVPRSSGLRGDFDHGDQRWS